MLEPDERKTQGAFLRVWMALLPPIRKGVTSPEGLRADRQAKSGQPYSDWLGLTRGSPDDTNQKPQDPFAGLGGPACRITLHDSERRSERGEIILLGKSKIVNRGQSERFPISRSRRKRRW